MRLRGALLVLALVGAIAFLVGDAARAWGSYLVNFLFWSGLSQAGVAFLALLQVTRARWGQPLVRSAEALAAFLPVSFALALLLPFGHGTLYRWLPTGSAREQFWLSRPFVSARLVLGLALLHGLSLLFLRRPRERLAPVVLLAYGVVLSLVSFDWIMSLDPRWFSTLLGGHFFIGTLYAGLGAIALLALLLPGLPLPAGTRHDHAKLLFGFCMLWMYMLYTQYLVIWYGDLPEETVFVMRRTSSAPWSGLTVFVVACGFVAPFVLLLSRRLKQSTPGLAGVATLALVGIFAERVLLVMPSLTDAGPFGLVELAVSAGFGAAFLLCILPRGGREPGGVMSKQAAVFAGLMLACGALAYGQTWDAPPEAKQLKRPAAADDKALERGKKLFQQNCAPCHGPAGKGDGPMGKAMGIKPGNLTNAERMAKQADGEIFWKVSKGKDPMPVFERKLSEKERWDVVAFVRTLAK
jgi:mono/diheme cytochrome c family protein/Ni/Fe-hydrogenase subunit HybB-like protein